MKIFWSWQSDLPGKISRHFVKEALQEAIQELKQPPGHIEEPTQAESRESMHLDHDRQGVSGSPDLARTIMDKIDESEVFVADVTPVSTIPAVEGRPEKRNMNPNVAIELGWALKSLSDRRVLMVLNEHYGGRRFLPFDLAHKAGPILYNLPPGASKEAIAAARRILKGNLVTALRPFLEQAGSLVDDPFPARPATTSKAVWFQPGEVIATFDGETEFGFDDDKGVYLRVMPRSRLPRPFQIGDLIAKTRNSQIGLLCPQQAELRGVNGDGVCSFEPRSPRGGPLKAASQVFPDGEVWGLSRALLSEDSYFGRIVAVDALNTAMAKALPRFLSVLEGLGVDPPYTIEFGAAGLKGFNVALDAGPDGRYRTVIDSFSESFSLPEVSTERINQALQHISERFFLVTTGYPLKTADQPQR